MSARRRSEKTGPHVYIAGESPLVDEYALACSEAGFQVACQWNKRPAGVKNESYRKSGVVPSGTLVAIELTNTDHELKRKNLRKLDAGVRVPGVILSSSVAVTVTEQASWVRHPGRLVGISALPSFTAHKLIEFAPAPTTEEKALVHAQEFFIRLGKQNSVVQDRIGMVLPRILCMIINEAYFGLQEGIASPEHVDLAMKLGTNYPLGPIEWGQQIGLRQVCAVLDALQRDLGEERYRTAPLLRQMAAGSA